MNSKLLFYSILTIFTSILNLQAQSTEIRNVNIYGSDLKNCGVISNNDNKTIYTLYNTLKESGDKSNIRALSFFDKELKEIKKLNFDVNDDNFLFEANNNRKNIILAFNNKSKQTNFFKIFSEKGDLLQEYETSASKLMFSPLYYSYAEKIADFDLTFPVSNKGFLVGEIIKKKRIGYNIHFIGDDVSKNWKYESPADHNNRKSIAPVFANDEIVILIEKEWGSNFDRQPTFKAIVLNASTGKEIFTTSHDYETVPNFYTKATVSKTGEIVLFGESYDLNNNYPDDDYNNGYFIERYSAKGDLISKNSVKFAENSFKTVLGFENNAKRKDIGTVYFYDIKEIDGKVFVVGQHAKRDNQGFSIAKGIIAGVTLGVSNIANQNWQSKYTLGDFIVLEFDKDNKLTQTHKIAKEKTLTGVSGMVVRPQFNLMEMEYDGRLDFIKDDFSENFYFINKKTENNSNIMDIKTIKFENSAFTTTDLNKINYSDKEVYSKLYSLDKDEVLFIKYNNENKNYKLEIIKK